jgi:hypothetical protein
MILEVCGQPMRYVAVFAVCPFLVILAILLLGKESRRQPVAYALIAFAFVFAVYESLWIVGFLTHAAD